MYESTLCLEYGYAPACFTFYIPHQAIFLSPCVDCPSCPAYLNSIGLATWSVWVAIKKYCLSFLSCECTYVYPCQVDISMCHYEFYLVLLFAQFSCMVFNSLSGG